MISDVFEGFRRFSDPFGCIRTCSDAFGRVRMRLDALGCSRKISEILGLFVAFFAVFGCFMILGGLLLLGFFGFSKAEGPTISGDNYSEPTLKGGMWNESLKEVWKSLEKFGFQRFPKIS